MLSQDVVSDNSSNLISSSILKHGYDGSLADFMIACLAAAKTIINEVKQDLPEESPILWTMQAFSVAAAVSAPGLDIKSPAHIA